MCPSCHIFNITTGQVIYFILYQLLLLLVRDGRAGHMVVGLSSWVSSCCAMMLFHNIRYADLNNFLKVLILKILLCSLSPDSVSGSISSPFIILVCLPHVNFFMMYFIYMCPCIIRVLYIKLVNTLCITSSRNFRKNLISMLNFKY